MILADTSVWIDHFRSDDTSLRQELGRGNIVIHPFVTAELALGSLKQRKKILALLDRLPQAQVAQLSEVRAMIEARRLYALGLGLIDAHLIASVLLTPPGLLWTRDQRLRKAAGDLGIDAGLL